MSVANTIQQIKESKESLRQALYIKGCQIPTSAKLSQYESYVSNMQVGIPGIDVSGSDYTVDLNDKCFIFYGNNEVIADSGTTNLLSNGSGSYSATNLSPENIKKGVKILGKTGTFTDAIPGVTKDSNGYVYIGNLAETSEKSVVCQGTQDQTYILSSTGNLTLSYQGGTISANNLSPANIKKGVSILGKTGTYDNDTLKALLDYSRRTYYMFRNNTYVTDLTPYFKFNTTSNVDNTGSMYYGCSNLIAVPLFDTSKVTYMANMFAYCSKITTIPAFNTSNTKDMSYMFYHCDALTTVPAFDTSKVTNMESMFYKCSNLKTLLMTGTKVSFDISASTKFERADLVTILNNLGTVSTSQTLTIGSTNLAKLTTEDKAIATNKGWTLA